MITQEQIDEWLKEVETRPESAMLIIQRIANRLRMLTSRNEELLAENTQLLTGQKVEEYEARIANLEYQLGLLKRQLSGEAANPAPADRPVEAMNLFLYTPKGQVLRIEVGFNRMKEEKVLGKIDASGAESGVQLLAANLNEELLFLFTSGRIITRAATEISVAERTLDWPQAYIEEPRPGEELAAIVPVGRMALADCVVQASRQGAIKKMPGPAFESYVAKGFVG